MFGRSPLLVVLLLFLFFFLSLSAVSEKSTTFDELQHLTAGYSYWLTNDYRLNPENGALPQRIAALPLLLRKQHFPSFNQNAWQTSNVLEMGYQMFYESGNDADTMLLSARSLLALAGALLGFLVFRWSTDLFGRQGGILSLTLYAFSPTLLANAPLVTSDLMLTLFLTSSVYLLWRFFREPRLLNAALCAFGIAGLFLSKFSAPIIIPIILLTAAAMFALGPKQNRQATWPRVTMTILFPIVFVIFAIWACYGFRFSAFSSQNSNSAGHFFERWEELGPIRFQHMIRTARNYRLLPEAYLYGFATVLKHGQSRRAFLNGNYSLHGWWYFFPYSFLIKTPIPVLLILLITIVAGLTKWKYLRGRGIREDLYDLSPLLILIIVYSIFAINSSLNIGHRHILPLYPALFILAGGSATLWSGPNQLLRISLWALMLWLVAEVIVVYPNFLTYFNQIAGGPRNGYLHMVDSSLDWGQDLPALKRKLEQENQATPKYLSYFGTASPAYYGIEAHRLPSYIDFRPQTANEKPWSAGIYCISATMLQSVYSYAPGHWSAPYERAYQHFLRNKEAPNRDFYLRQLRFARLCAYLRHRSPDDYAGYSILLFHLTKEDLDRALNGAPAELVPAVDMR